MSNSTDSVEYKIKIQRNSGKRRAFTAILSRDPSSTNSWDSGVVAQVSRESLESALEMVTEELKDVAADDLTVEMADDPMPIILSEKVAENCERMKEVAAQMDDVAEKSGKLIKSSTWGQVVDDGKGRVIDRTMIQVRPAGEDVGKEF